MINSYVDLKKSIDGLLGILKTLKVLDEKANEVVVLARAYASDSKHFLEQGNEFDALEAYSISWAYIDSLLHLGMVEVDNLEGFTLGDE